MPWGDVVIEEFVSVVEAVPCAVETTKIGDLLRGRRETSKRGRSDLD
jgi:hypothetical protein